MAESPEQLRKRLLGKLKGMEMIIGCSTEELLQVLALEISARLPQSQPAPAIDVDEIVNKVTARLPDFKVMSDKISVAIESHLAVKLDEVMGLVQQSMSAQGTPPDPTSIIKGVAAVLQPQILEASKVAAETVFSANQKALLDEVNKAMESKFSQLQATAPQPDPNAAGAGAPVGRPGMGSGLMQMALSNPEGLKGLAEALKAILDVFKPAPAPASAALNDFSRFMNFHDLMTKIEKRTATSDDIAKGIGNVFGAAAPQVPAPAGQASSSQGAPA